MAKIQTYKAKLNPDGTRYIDPVTNDFVNELVSEIEVESEPEKPNWYGLEQSLYKSPLFTKYLQDYNTKGLLFTTTIQNGKRGEDVNEQTLLMGFAAMQIDFDQNEIDTINTLLTNNNFTIQL